MKTTEQEEVILPIEKLGLKVGKWYYIHYDGLVARIYSEAGKFIKEVIICEEGPT